MNTRSFFRRIAGQRQRQPDTRDVIAAMHARFVAEVAAVDLNAMTPTEAARRLGALVLKARALPKRQTT